MSAWHGAVVGVVAVAAVAWGLHDHGRTADAKANPVAKNDGASAKVAELSRELTVLELEVQGLRENAASRGPEGPAASAGSPVATPVAAEPEPPEAVQARERAQAARVAALVDERHDAEPRDPSWSSQAERDIGHAVRSTELAGIHFDSADCRQTICRAVVSSDGPDSARQFGPELLKEPPFDHDESYFQYLGGHVIVYLLREGQPFPEERQERQERQEREEKAKE